MFPILIVDDARDDLMLAESMLRHCKIQNPIVTIANGDDCIRYFREEWAPKEIGAPVPCLLFLDLAMRPTSGLEVLNAIVKTRLANDSMLVMLSGIRDIKTVQRGYQLGAKTFLIKPLNAEDFMRFLEAMRDRIRVNESEQGYMLDFVTPASDNAKTNSEPMAGRPQNAGSKESPPASPLKGDYIMQIR